MLLIWYNPTKEKIFTSYVSYTSRGVGFTNSYGHEILQILVFYDNDYI